ncbi:MULTISPECIES: AAA family ATPase [unclassified Leptolyngbya]|uniref:AAA family ATPase n=1 Tax=unclassified Leptolyngbya TaxID=2650499 RepID=UPI001682515A|nr:MULTISPECIES: AAA family ATPase [unclassified Leptolyngbya]MBD1913710.1 AAA family ATPase [Leptolyngbya sp. FACHB-8]MBD2155326.1 AAA family ATPase [Leptolyngbya sp. FACHB-16]
MIPLQLTLKNFLSYRDTSLDFRGLHIACICGANGAGKSSLLEAIAWALWGQGRASTDDDVIHQGELEARVDFVFQCQEQTYRVIRSRVRGQTSQLEFQVQTNNGFRSLTGRGMRATQLLIVQTLRMDYETFVNSAYLRQGRADEFMLKRPGERKQVLADLLQLDRYDQLSEQAKEQARQLKAEVELLERTLDSLSTQLEQGSQLAIAHTNLTVELEQLHQQQAHDQEVLQQLQHVRQQRQGWRQQLGLLQQQQQLLHQDCQRLTQEQHQIRQQQKALEAVLQQAEAIAVGCEEYYRLLAEEESQSAKFHAHQAATAQLQTLQSQLQAHVSTLQDKQRTLQVQQENLQQQLEEVNHTLRKSGDVETALGHLQRARDRLAALDQQQVEAAPLLQRRQHIQADLDRLQTRMGARLEELRTATQELQQQQQRQPHLRQAVLEISTSIAYLEQRRYYQQQVREKGVERRNFLERLQERQRKYEAHLAELAHKIAMLEHGEHGSHAQDATAHAEVMSVGVREGGGHYAEQVVEEAEFPPCPLCDRPLDEHHWALVLERYYMEQQDIQQQIWVLREQLTTSDREIQLLRQEYRELEQELAQYAIVLERRGQLQQQLQGASEGQTRLQQLLQEQAVLESALQHQQYAPELQEELALLDTTLAQLNYDDKNHALARGEVDRWRWAEIRQAELKQAERRRSHLLQRLPDLEVQQAEIQRQLAAIATAPLQQEIRQLEEQIVAIAYNLDHHTALRQALRQAQQWPLRQQELAQAQQQYPQLAQRLQDLEGLIRERYQGLEVLTDQVEALTHQLEQQPDPEPAIYMMEGQLQQRRQQLDDQIAQIGRLQQQQQHLETLKTQQIEQTHRLQASRRQLRVYQELAQAFGKNGIQALMIENVLPQLEAEANQILGRLSNHQLHVQFVTQRSRKGSNRKAIRLIDTLDILIADARGTRPYETYSGGEAFRINFAIRLALARLLALRSGMALQLLIVDEGFGTQDEAGCDRLISAIQAIADDFACILTVTHMPRLKEAFQTRIEVNKTIDGSKVSLVV